MSWIGRFFGRRTHDRHVDDELRFHVEQETERHIAEGASLEEARRRALASFGGVEQAKEACDDARGTGGAESVLQDVRYGVRSLRHDRSFTAMAVLSLALGLGACVTVFAVTRALVLQDLPFPNADRLVRVHEIDARGGSWEFSAPDLADLGDRAHTLEQVAGFRSFHRTLSDGRNAIPVLGAEVTRSFFQTLGLVPLAGETFSFGAAQPGADTHVAILTHSLWTSLFQGDPRAVGRSLTLGGQSYLIVGVVADIPDLLPGAQILAPLDLDRSADRGARDIAAVARLAPSATETQAQAEMTSLADAIALESPLTNTRWGLRAEDLKASIIGTTVKRVVWVQCGVVMLFALLACTNVAGLLLARGRARRAELSVRAALGASRGRLIRQLLIENGVLAIAGSAFGLGLSAAAIDVIRNLGPQILPRLVRVQFDPWLLVFTAVLTVLVVPICGLGPALAGSRAALQAQLAQRGRSVSARTRGRNALVAGQIAIATTLLVAAALLFKSFLALGAVDPGFESERLLTATPILDGTTLPDDRLVPFYTDLTARIARLPGVAAVGATSVTPLGAWSSAVEFRRADRPENTTLLQANWRTVTPGFFRAMGLPLVEGRLIDERDTASAPAVVVITTSFARLAWPSEDALGKQVVWGRTGKPKTVVGVVGDLRDHTLDREPQPTMFRAYPQLPWADMTVVVRAKGDPVALTHDVRRAIQDGAPDVAVEIATMDQALSAVLLPSRVNMLMLAAFAGLALTLAAVGLYGVVSYAVRARQREIAIRTSLGGQPAAILWTLVRQALLLAFAGGVTGLVGGLAASRAIAALLYQTRPTDPLVYLGVLLTLSVVVIAASLVPARQALHVDPILILKQE